MVVHYVSVLFFLGFPFVVIECAYWVVLGLVLALTGRAVGIHVALRLTWVHNITWDVALLGLCH